MAPAVPNPAAFSDVKRAHNRAPLRRRLGQRPRRMKVSVIIVTKNPGAGFTEVLRTVRAQETGWPFDILVADNGSSDGTLEFIRRYSEVRLLQIPGVEFGHGRSRNLAISEVEGDLCVLLTQDALPASRTWLSSLVNAVTQAPDIAGAFGPHLAYPAHSAYVHRDLQTHFEQFQHVPLVVSRDTDPERYKTDLSWRQMLHFYSNNNSCLRRRAWKEIPFPDVDFAEDQIWAAKIIEAGWKKAYAPEAAVFHSHEYGPFNQLRRAFDESRSFRRLFGYRLGGDLRETVRSGAGLGRTDWQWGRSRGLPLGHIISRMGKNFCLVAGHSLGAREDRLPDSLKFFLSRDKTLYQSR
jgi:rhamnosyltransferase